MWKFTANKSIQEVQYSLLFYRSTVGCHSIMKTNHAGHRPPPAVFKVITLSVPYNRNEGIEIISLSFGPESSIHLLSYSQRPAAHPYRRRCGQQNGEREARVSRSAQCFLFAKGQLDVLSDVMAPLCTTSKPPLSFHHQPTLVLCNIDELQVQQRTSIA